jgi:hypothetical protein
MILHVQFVKCFDFHRVSCQIEVGLISNAFAYEVDDWERRRFLINCLIISALLHKKFSINLRRLQETFLPNGRSMRRSIVKWGKYFSVGKFRGKFSDLFV